MPFIGIKRTFWPRLRNSESPAADNGATTVSHNGLITISSAYSVEDTINRVETDIKLKGLTVFARVDHAAGAMEVGLSLAPTQISARRPNARSCSCRRSCLPASNPRTR